MALETEPNPGQLQFSTAPAIIPDGRPKQRGAVQDYKKLHNNGADHEGYKQ